MKDGFTYGDKLAGATDGHVFSTADSAAAIQKDNGKTAIGGPSDNNIFKNVQLSREQLSALGFNPDVSIDGHSKDAKPKDANPLAETIKGFEKDHAKTSGGASVDGVTDSGDVVWKDPTDGWTKTGFGSWEKNSPLPKNWDFISAEQRAQYLKDVTAQDMDPFMLVGPDGSARVGYHKDPSSGEYYWFGYVGEEPKGPPPTGGNSHYYQ